MKENERIERHIIIMSIIGIIRSLFGLLLLGKPAAFLMLGVLPMMSIILFLASKNPIFGCIYTVLFCINRLEILWKGTLLAKVGIFLMIEYFVYVDYKEYIEES